MKIRLFIFDLDGTLLDSIDDIAFSMNHVLEKNGFPTHQRDAYYYFVGDGSVTVGDDEVTFTPRIFTLLVARRDRFALLALAGGIITLLGLALAFLIQPKMLWAIRADNGNWTIRGQCRKGQALMREQLEEAVRTAAEGEKKYAER